MKQPVSTPMPTVTNSRAELEAYAAATTFLRTGGTRDAWIKAYDLAVADVFARRREVADARALVDR